MQWFIWDDFLNAIGGSGNYEYLWSPIVNAENVADSLPVGEYFITITDANDPTCFHIISVELTLDNNLEMIIEDMQPSLALENTGSIVIEVNVGDEFYYELLKPGGNVDSDTLSGSTLEFNDLGIGFYQLIIEEINSGCRDTIVFEIELISSIFESKINEIDQLQVFPNPVNAILYFEEEVNENKYLMYSLEGKMMNRGILEKNYLDLTGFNPGVYILIVENANGVKKMAKVVKVE